MGEREGERVRLRAGAARTVVEISPGDARERAGKKESWEERELAWERERERGQDREQRLRGRWSRSRRGTRERELGGERAGRRESWEERELGGERAGRRESWEERELGGERAGRRESWEERELGGERAGRRESWEERELGGERAGKRASWEESWEERELAWEWERERGRGFIFVIYLSGGQKRWCAFFHMGRKGSHKLGQGSRSAPAFPGPSATPPPLCPPCFRRRILWLPSHAGWSPHGEDSVGAPDISTSVNEASLVMVRPGASLPERAAMLLPRGMYTPMLVEEGRPPKVAGTAAAAPVVQLSGVPTGYLRYWLGWWHAVDTGRPAGCQSALSIQEARGGKATNSKAPDNDLRAACLHGPETPRTCANGFLSALGPGPFGLWKSQTPTTSGLPCHSCCPAFPPPTGLPAAP